ncbi:hypothetical protein QEZ54_22130 [Catellatospora sp. KI3]|uniref:hypothetical protein n=1 Tax=Catellatospora sp. KI3 TaxID=3041620 RepID=UPI002482A398|nr:hypothetical protein [Catellatospora sp. KI3]MDI1463685.1 hypothetical protein [Catellatospora sp. KI3]
MRDDIDRRLRWTRDLISDDPAVRERALLRHGLIADPRATLPADLRGPGPDGTIEA